MSGDKKVEQVAIDLTHHFPSIFSQMSNSPIFKLYIKFGGDLVAYFGFRGLGGDVNVGCWKNMEV